MADHSQEEDALVAQFAQVTGAQPGEALEYLRAHQFNIQSAVTDYFAEPEHQEANQMDSDLSADDEPVPVPQTRSAQSTQASSQGGGRRLGDGTEDSSPVAASSSSQPVASSSRPPQPQPQRKKFATLGDLSSGGHEHPSNAPDDSDDDDSKHDLFAGGEKSGLAVQNPDDLKKKILEKAKQAQRRPAEEPKPRPSHFTGAARTLGGDETPSQVVEPPQPIPGMQRPPRVDRVLHFWNDGFSIDDGDLYRSDDPQNRQILDGIRRGSAPLHIMNVLPGQEVDVEIQQHSENYVKPKKKYKPFEGQGQRLGSPTPGTVQTTSTVTVPTSSIPEAGPAKVDVNDSEPTVTLQIRLGDGSRLTSRFNTSHTIGDVYSFVTTADPASSSRSWVLMTTFPSRELTDKAAVLGDLPDFKRGGAVVQKWT